MGVNLAGVKSMDKYLMLPILEGIYKYMRWSDLEKYVTAPDRVWKSIYEYLMQDENFRFEIKQYWDLEPGVVSHRTYILRFIEAKTKHPYGLDIEILMKDREFVLRCLKIGALNHHGFLDDRELMLHHGRWFPEALKNTSLRSERNFGLEVVKKNGFAVMYLADELKYDEEILREAAIQVGVRWEDDLKRVYKNITIIMFRNRWNTFVSYGDLDEWLKDDLDIKNIFKYKWINMKMADRETVLYSVQHGMNLSYVSQEYRDDPDIVLEALMHSAVMNYNYMGSKLRSNRALIMKCVKFNGLNFLFADNFAADPEVVLSALATHPLAFQLSHVTLTTNKEFVMKALEIDRSVFRFVDHRLKRDKDVLAIMMRI